MCTYETIQYNLQMIASEEHVKMHVQAHTHDIMWIICDMQNETGKMTMKTNKSGDFFFMHDL